MHGLSSADSSLAWLQKQVVLAIDVNTTLTGGLMPGTETTTDNSVPCVVRDWCRVVVGLLVTGHRGGTTITSNMCDLTRALTNTDTNNTS